MWLFVITFALLIFWLYKLTSPSARLREYGDKIPGPKIFPFIGTMFIFSKKANMTILQDLHAKYGPIFRLWLGGKLVVILTDPEDLEVFFSSTKFIDKPYTHQRLFKAWLGDKNLLTSNGEIWKLHRKMLTPSFHFKFVENSLPMVLRNAKILCDKIETEAGGSGFSIEQYIEKSTLDIICETAMGIQLESQLAEKSDYLDCIKNVSKLLLKRLFSPWLHSETIFKLSQTGKSYYKNLKIIKDLGQKVIQERKKRLEEKNEPEQMDDYDGIGRKKLKPFLDFMLTQGSFNDLEVENEVQTFMAAGFNTIKSAVSFCLYTLAYQQEIQKKLFNEINETLSGLDGDPTYQDFNNMKYLEQVIKESMRLHSPVPFISRYVSEDITLPSGYVLPADSQADISIFLTHRNDKYFPDPEKFMPERFESREDSKNPYAYVPFSAGPRNCIGQKFAMLEMKVLLSLLLLKYQFLPDEQANPIILETRITLQSKNKLPVKIRKRN